MSEKKQNQNFDSIFIFVIIGLGAAALYQVALRIGSFYHAHQIRFFIILGLMAAAGGILLFFRLINFAIKNDRKGDDDVLILGESTKTGEPVWLSDDDRTTHTQVIGTTRSGKTFHVVSPIISHDIAAGNGCLVIDGKSDWGFVKLINDRITKSKRTDICKLLLGNPKDSGKYNPFYWGTPEQITERFFSAFPFENSFYKTLQYNALLAVLIGILKRGKTPTPKILHGYLKDTDSMKTLVAELGGHPEEAAAIAVCYEGVKNYQENQAGLINNLAQISSGDVGCIFDSADPTIRLDEIYRKRSIFYAQIPTMQFQTLGPAIGRLILLELMQVISVAQVANDIPQKLLSVILDDFNDFMFEGFGSLLNKGRTGNVGVVFSHQSMGDLDRVSANFRNIVLTNTNVKVILKTPDPDSAEILSRLLGTQTTAKRTDRVQSAGFRSQKTGDASEREVEEFKFHPNVLKSELTTGEGIVLKPGPDGTLTERVRFLNAEKKNGRKGV
jgi:intracellular multiplication protein IcmO